MNKVMDPYLEQANELPLPNRTFHIQSISTSCSIPRYELSVFYFLFYFGDESHDNHQNSISFIYFIINKHIAHCFSC